ncbi:hypothetical protein MES5069_480017 [Mesorhizobium escarrei]|uniref:Uncharacterized protein n=1 Tax=Mesorhizobium escarrei TaxID=666018 RepID=A0ABN8K5R5_9HYPH|nr:hypothetical protein MES5069_480017 [Mesorhizobium escarrei]
MQMVTPKASVLSPQSLPDPFCEPRNSLLGNFDRVAVSVLRTPSVGVGRIPNSFQFGDSSLEVAIG